MSPDHSSSRAVVIVGAHPYPYGNASANRMLTMAQTWAAAGWAATVINDDPRLTRSTLQRGSADDVDYVNLGSPTSGRVSRLVRRRTLPRRIVGAMRELQLTDDVTHVVVPSFFFTPSLSRTVHRSLPGCKTVVDVVERHDIAQFDRGLLDLYLLRHRFTSVFTALRADMVIVITDSLAGGPFRNTSPLVLPPCAVGDLSSASDVSRTDSRVRVSYLGSPGTKDDLSCLLRALPMLEPDIRQDLVVTLAGFAPEALAELPGLTHQVIEEAAPTVEVVGQLDRGGVIRLLGQSHFSYLLREPTAGYARFGFPSKISEALAGGCPPLTNLTSDLGKYLEDDRNSIICRDFTPAAVADSLTRAVQAVRDGKHDEMRSAAMMTASTMLAPAAHAGALTAWLKESSS